MLVLEGLCLRVAESSAKTMVIHLSSKVIGSRGEVIYV
jgi:hypothetical protein